MINRDEAERARQALYDALDVPGGRGPDVMARIEAVSREHDIEAFAGLLMLLTGLAFDEATARRHWDAILDNRAELGAALRRDVGARVAVLDYFINIHQRLRLPSFQGEGAEVPEDPLTDRLSGMANAAAFRAAVHAETLRARRYGRRFSVILSDLDDYSGLRERLGDALGDSLLAEVARALESCTRDTDLRSRPGEDEFAVLLPETDRAEGWAIAENFRAAVERGFSRLIGGSGSVSVRLSAGVACYPDDAYSGEALLQRAAQALYEAKAAGGNRVLPWREERRRHLRVNCPRAFRAAVTAPQATPIEPTDLSRGGMLFASPAPLAVGERVELSLALPERPFVLGATVVRSVCHDGGGRWAVGVAFDAAAAAGLPDPSRIVTRSPDHGG